MRAHVAAQLEFHALVGSKKIHRLNRHCRPFFVPPKADHVQNALISRSSRLSVQPKATKQHSKTRRVQMDRQVCGLGTIVSARKFPPALSNRPISVTWVIRTQQPASRLCTLPPGRAGDGLRQAIKGVFLFFFSRCHSCRASAGDQRSAFGTARSRKLRCVALVPRATVRKRAKPTGQRRQGGCAGGDDRLDRPRRAASRQRGSRRDPQRPWR